MGSAASVGVNAPVMNATNDEIKVVFELLGDDSKQKLLRALRDSEEGAQKAGSKMDPKEYVNMFKSRKTFPAGSVKGLCGRFIRGTRPEHFDLLSDEPGKRLSWVCDDELLFGVLGKSAAEAMIHIGRRVDWLEARLRDGTSHKLVVFPATDCKLATWDNLFEMVCETYNCDVARRLEPHLQSLKATPYDEIDPDGRFPVLTQMPVLDKFDHPEFLSAERFAALEEPVSLYQARGFFYCAIGCNSKFTGLGVSPDGEREFMTRNRAIADIDDHVLLDLEITEADIRVLSLNHEA